MLSLEELRENRPPEVGFARVLLIAAVILWVPVVGVLYGPTVGFAGVLMFLVVFGSFGAVKGRQAGRVMTTVALGLLYLPLVPYCWLGFRDPYMMGPFYAVLDIVAVAASAVALTQLWHPATNRYVHLVTVAMRARP